MTRALRGLSATAELLAIVTMAMSYIVSEI